MARFANTPHRSPMPLRAGRKSLILFLSFIGTFGCSGSNNATPSAEAGGTESVGGAAAGGSPAASGGSSNGNPGTGGSVGGATSAAHTGGQPATGGNAPATGGSLATGGINATGGRPAATGGTNATATGGTIAVATGGTIAVATGGTIAAATGGARASGGLNSTGGAPSSGGVTPTGGTRATGGATSNGGKSATGGDSSYSPCPAAGTACAVLPLGDSITEGCCTAPMGGYRIELFRQALTNSKNITFVGSLTNGPTTVNNQAFPQHHEGHGGYTIDSGTGHNGISGQITDSAISNYHPNIVILTIGTNDINGNIDTANAPTRLGNLMDEIIKDAPSALLVVSAIIPTTNDGTNNNVRTYNAAIPGLVDTRVKAGKHVVFVDNYTAFSQNSNYKTALMADGLHPNDAGYVVLGQSFYKAISSVLP